MKLGIRGKLFAISVTLICSVGFACGLYLEGELRDELEHRIEGELHRYATTAREIMELVHEPSAAADSSIESVIESVDELADRLGSQLENRITVIAPDGRVLGDSAITTAKVVQMDNHGKRPEVLEALSSKSGVSYRYSHTVNADLVYVAVRYEHEGRHGVVRAARRLAEVDGAVSRLRMLLLAVGLIGLAVAIGMSALASHFMSLTLRQLERSARAMAATPDKLEPSGGERIAVVGSDEVSGLAGSLNRMAESIQTTVAALVTERARFAAILEGMSEAVIALESDGSISLMNHAALEFLELDEAPLGEPLINHLRVPAMIELMHEQDASQPREVELPGELPRRVMAQVSPEHDSGGCIIVMYDVTSVRRLETVRRDFVANVSHELRTPVSVIRANAETLCGGAADDPVHSKRLLDGLVRNAERLSLLLDDLLDLARLEAGRYRIQSRDVAVAAAVDKAIHSIERAAQNKSIALRCDIDESLRVNADDKALDQILVNYLDNAVKYTPEGGEVSIKATLAQGRVRIEVIDNGPGIAHHLRVRIFERFFRVDPGRSRDMGGTGLGLSIVKHLAEAMDGDAGVDGHEPHGSRFWISLPKA